MGSSHRKGRISYVITMVRKAYIFIIHGILLISCTYAFARKYKQTNLPFLINKPQSRNYTQHTALYKPVHFPTSSGENLSLPLLTNLIGTLPLRS